MLSFDVTDNNIKIVKGYENSSRVNIEAAVSLDIDDELIVDGKIMNVQKLADFLSAAIMINGMKDREAIVSIFSNHTIFKELLLPKAKERQLFKMVKTEMQAALGLDDRYCYSYVISGEENDNGVLMEKVFATACPYEIVEGYKKLFYEMDVSLKAVMIGCSSISGLLLSDLNTKFQMPLLTVMINKDFLNTNIYDDGGLEFSRYIKISPNDYPSENNYVVEAAKENIFRMVQFQKTRSSTDIIKNVIFYGDLSNYSVLSQSVLSMELNPSVIALTSQADGCENIDISEYANAVGALFKRNGNKEKVNLLENETCHKRYEMSDSKFAALFVIAAVMTIVVIAGLYFAFLRYYESINERSDRLNKKIEASEEIQLEYTELAEREKYLENYITSAGKVIDVFRTYPQISFEYINIIENIVAESSAELGLNTYITELQYENYELTVHITSETDADPSQKVPAMIAEKLSAYKEFSNVTYSGYTIYSADTTAMNSIIMNEIKITLNPAEFSTETESQGGKIEKT